MDLKVPLNARIPKELNDEVTVFQEKERLPDKTAAVCLLLKEGLMARKESERYRRLFELVNLKTLFVLREIAKSRGEDFVRDIDERYESQREDIEQLIIEFGVSFNDQ